MVNFSKAVFISLCAVTLCALSVCRSNAADDVQIKQAEDVTVAEPLVGKNIKIITEKNLATKSNIDATNEVGLRSGANTHVGGSIRAGGKINISAKGGIKVNGAVKSGGDINLYSGQDIVINNTIEGQTVNAISGEDIKVDADVTGHKGVTMTTEGNGALEVSPSSSLNSPDGKVELNSKNLDVQGTINQKNAE